VLKTIVIVSKGGIKVMLSSIESKLNYHHWATMRLLNYINELNDDFFLKEVKSIFPSLAAIFEHIYQIDLMWAKRMLGEEQSVMENIKFGSPKVAIQFFEKIFQEYKLLGFKEGMITYKNTKGEEFQNSFHEIIEHVTNHGTYHRGTVSAVLHQLGEKSVSTDYIFFLREAKSG
jgi:uncharacterized damage-inducible protein DinB